MSSRPYGRRHRQRRAELLARAAGCVWCGSPWVEVADHSPPLSQHHHRSGTNCCELVASCRECSQRQAGVLGGAFRRR